jgi:hypothetical protein
MRNILVVFVLCILVTSFRNDHQISNDFVGIWTLRKCVTIGKNGEVNYPFGENAMGQLLYDEKGNMMAQIMKPGIKKFTSAGPIEATVEEALPAYRGFIAYYGTYSLKRDSGVIIHHVKACSFPNWVDEDQRRYYEFKNSRLILKTP